MFQVGGVEHGRAVLKTEIPGRRACWRHPFSICAVANPETPTVAATPQTRRSPGLKIHGSIGYLLQKWQHGGNRPHTGEV